VKTPSQHPARSFRKQLATATPIFAILCLATTLIQAQGVAPVNQNVNQIATLHWYPVNRIPAVFSLGSGSAYGTLGMLAFDGARMLVTTSSGEVLGCPTGGEAFQTPNDLNCETALPTENAGGSWLAYDGVRVWTVKSASNTVNVYPPNQYGGQTFAVGTNPQGIAFDGGNIWVANSGSNTVTKLGASLGGLKGTFAVGTAPVGVAFDSFSIWVANSGSNNVTKLRTSDGTVLGTFAVGTAPMGVAYDGANIWVANSGSSSVTKLRASDGTVLGTFTVGAGPYALAYDGANIWVTCRTGNSVYELLASTGAVEQTIAMPAAPQGVAFDGTSIWVTLPSINSLAKL
jgi:hypothetical protein